MSFRGRSGGRRGRDFIREKGKSHVVGRSDGRRHQASDEAHASSFSYKGRGRSFGNTQCFYCQKYGHTIKFYLKKIENEKKKESSFMSVEEKKRG